MTKSGCAIFLDRKASKWVDTCCMTFIFAYQSCIIHLQSYTCISYTNIHIKLQVYLYIYIIYIYIRYIYIYLFIITIYDMYLYVYIHILLCYAQPAMRLGRRPYLWHDSRQANSKQLLEPGKPRKDGCRVCIDKIPRYFLKRCFFWRCRVAGINLSEFSAGKQMSTFICSQFIRMFYVFGVPSISSSFLPVLAICLHRDLLLSWQTCWACKSAISLSFSSTTLELHLNWILYHFILTSKRDIDLMQDCLTLLQNMWICQFMPWFT